MLHIVGPCSPAFLQAASSSAVCVRADAVTAADSPALPAPISTSNVQKLGTPITDFARVASQEHELYLAACYAASAPDAAQAHAKTVLVGGLKVGRKKLFIADVRSLHMLKSWHVCVLCGLIAVPGHMA